MKDFRHLMYALAALLWVTSYALAGNKAAVKSCWTSVIVLLSTAALSLLSG